MKATTQAMTTTITAAMAPPIAAEAFTVGEFRLKGQIGFVRTHEDT